MKVAVSTVSNTLDSEIDQRFGRARFFLLVDTEDMSFEAIENTQNYQAVQGAGIQSAGNVIDAGAEAVLTGHCGPRAFSVLNAAGVKIYIGVEGPVLGAIESLKKGELSETASPDVEGHW